MGSTQISNVRYHKRTSWRVQGGNVDVLIGLARVAARANVEVERKRRFEVFSPVDEDLPFTLAGEIPNHTDAWLKVVLEVVELQVGEVVTTVGLLIIPPQTAIKLDVLGKLVVVLDIERFHARFGKR